MYVYMYVRIVVCACEGQKQLLSFPHVGNGDWTQIARFASKDLYLLSHLISATPGFSQARDPHPDPHTVIAD